VNGPAVVAPYPVPDLGLLVAIGLALVALGAFMLWTSRKGKP
jgi:hypothetical protein